MDKLRKIFEKARKVESYGNGRFVRKILEEAQMNLAERIVGLPADRITTELVSTIDDCDLTEPPIALKVANRMGFTA